MIRWFASLFLVCLLAKAATTWYVDVDATGTADGTSWANAWTNLQSAGDGSGVLPGDTVLISGGLYTNRTGFYLENGTAGNWVTYRSSQDVGHNDEVTLKCQVSIRGYTAFYGDLVPDYETNILDNTYLVPLITNNCNLLIDKQDDPSTNQIAITVWSGPVILKWLHVRGAAQAYDPGGMVIYYAGDDPLTAATSMEVAYVWSDCSTGHGHLGLPGAVAGEWSVSKTHHCLFENHWADNCQNQNGMDYHHNVVRHRGDLTNAGGCNDTFQGSGGWCNVRIYNNVIEPTDNSLIVMAPHGWFSNVCFYNNVIVPVPTAYLPTNTVRDFQGGNELNTASDVQSDPILVTNVWFANNTVDHSAHGPEFFIGLKNIHYQLHTHEQFQVQPGGFHIVNNLLLQFDNPGNATAAPITCYGTTDDMVGQGWLYTTNDLILDYNVWWSTNNGRCATWRDGADPTRLMFTNATDIANETGFTHNMSESPVVLRDKANYDYRPVDFTLNIGTNLTTLTNLMPSLDTDIYGRPRSSSGAWTVGAAQNDDMLLWLTFNLDDSWTNAHVITDHSGWTNNAVYFASTNHEAWPTWTNGPNALPAAQFVVNWTNPPGGYRFGTYAAITNILDGGLAVMTNGTWSLWAAIDTNHVSTDSADFFLSSGLESNNWGFGKYYCDGPLFLRPTGWGGMEPWEAYVRWPNITTTNWQHYAITWDGTTWTPYLNGVVYLDTMSWTNDGNYGYATYTNKWTGSLYATNSAGGVWNWIGLGVLTHSGTPDPDDVDGQPSNGQLWGRLADVRIYNRALTAAEIEAIYELSGEEAEPATPVTSRAYVTGTVRAGQVRPP